MDRIVKEFTEHLVKTDYVRNFTWTGIPILQYPSDLMVMQELIFTIKPDVIIETGVAHGGMSRFYSDMLTIIGKTRGIVVGVDKYFSDKTLQNLAGAKIEILEGDSVSEKVLEEVKSCIDPEDVVLVSLDSNHSHAHVLKELRLYAPLVSVGSYIVAYDTAIEFYHHLDKEQNRPWSKGNSPWSAVQKFMKNNDEFIVDKDIEQHALITAAPGGYLKRIKEKK